ncbi:MAG: Nif3-like dinuclear metal center hexameric protein [Flavobacteriales bacterium]|nr:Nif3-like dinuclear metal center hexameric protein [Flavobacteriales bacterium]
MKLAEIIKYLEQAVPLSYQESYDNSGLLVGDETMRINSVLTCLDCTEEVIQDAIDKKCNLIISHHPIIFKSIKQLVNRSYVERVVFKAIKNNIAIYALHTNLDNILDGVSYTFSERIGLSNVKILKKKNEGLSKLITYVPKKYFNKIQTSLFNVGAGKIGDKYDQCSFYNDGIGTFRPLEEANPYIGENNKKTAQKEIKLELIFPTFLQKKVISVLHQNHPYEEVAHEIIPLKNPNNIGSGVIGDLNDKMDVFDFFKLLKKEIPYSILKHTNLIKKDLKKIAFCGGSGSFLINEAINQGADIYISSDFKYHDFFEADGKIILADIGHYETEQFVAERIYRILKKNFPKLDVILTNIDTNPISYY